MKRRSLIYHALHCSIIMLFIFTAVRFTPIANATACPSLPLTANTTYTNCTATISTTTGIDISGGTETSTSNTSVLTLGNSVSDPTQPVSITINNGGTLAVNTILMRNNATITIQAGGAIKAGPTAGLWAKDTDGDGWATDFTTIRTSTASGFRRLSLMKSLTSADCNGTDGTKWQNINGYTDVDGDGHGTGSLTPVCSGATLATGYTTTDNTDCNDTGTNSANVWVSATCYTDTDNDNYGAGTAKTCTNNATCGSATWASGANGTAAAAATLADNDTDCNDASLYENKACGGTLTTSGNYSIHTFNSSGTLTVTGSVSVDYLVVAGGGGGGSNHGAGGGGGGYLAGTLAVTAQSYAVTVGTGGTKGSPNGAPGNNGGDSVFSSITATGGGGGAAGGVASSNGYAGGSGGGSASYTGYSGHTGGSAASGQGYKGSNTVASGSLVWCAGGGGGAGGAAANKTCTANGQVVGGVGKASSITGLSVTYATGGNGYNDAGNYWPGTDGLGKGSGPYGAGGSGVIIIRYLYQ